MAAHSRAVLDADPALLGHDFCPCDDLPPGGWLPLDTGCPLYITPRAVEGFLSAGPGHYQDELTAQVSHQLFVMQQAVPQRK